MNCLVDSNLFIYATDPEDVVAYPAIMRNAPFGFASVTKIEVLGYDELTPEVKRLLEKLFSLGSELELSQAVVGAAIALRQSKMMSLGDAIIAATAIQHNVSLLTRNSRDFQHLTELSLENPYE